MKNSMLDKIKKHLENPDNRKQAKEFFDRRAKEPKCPFDVKAIDFIKNHPLNKKKIK